MAKEKTESRKGSVEQPGAPLSRDEGDLGLTLEEALNEISEDEIIKNDTAEEYHLRKNRFLKISCSEIKDELGGKYVVRVNEPLKQFDTKLAKAYAVSEKRGGDADKYYALILDKRVPVRLAEINKLLGKTQEGFANVVAAQLIPSALGKGRFFTVIVQRPHGVTLQEYVEKNGPLPEPVVVDKIIPALNAVLELLEKRSVVHGRINPRNVYIDDEGKVTLGECVSEPSGYSQEVLYEHPDRATALPIAKGEGDITTDYYALGVLVAYMLTGEDPTIGIVDTEILEFKFSPGTYRFVVKNTEFSPHVLDLLRGTINDKKKEIWASEEIKQWSQGRRFNLLPPASSAEASRSITFLGKKYQNRKHLVHALYNNWDAAKLFCREDTLVRWVDRSVQDSDLAEKMHMAATIVTGHRSGSFTRDDELLAQYILFLDPDGPLRIQGVATNMDGVGPLLAQGYAENKPEYLIAVTHILEHNFISLWADLKAKRGGGKRESRESRQQEVLFALEKSEKLYKKKEVGFGLERCLYELNPTLPCQSTMMLEGSVFTVEEVLKHLEKMESLTDEIIDRQIAAFLASCIDLPRKIRITSLAKFPDFADNMSIQTLAMLAHSQQTSRVERLPDLCVKVLDSLEALVETFHNAHIKENLEKNLIRSSKQGSLINMLATISDTKYLVRDRVGFSRAAKKFKHNAIQILKLSNRKAINNIGYRYGLQLAVMLSFIVATFVFVILVMKSF